MSDLYNLIEVSPRATVKIGDLALELQVQANQQNSSIRFSFSGVDCVVHPKGDTKKLINEYEKALEPRTAES